MKIEYEQPPSAAAADVATPSALPLPPSRGAMAAWRTDPGRAALAAAGAGAGAPAAWDAVYAGIRSMRADADAPVDTMGCERLADPDAPAAVQRFQVLVSLMLSSQTKDEVTYAAMGRLRAFGCTPDRLAAAPEEALQKLIYPVGFYRKKAETLRLAAQRCLSEHGGDIPPDLPGLLRLKGVGPKMAHIAMTSAWGRGGGIGVDVHVHRVANRLRWVGRSGGAPPTEGKLEGADRHGTAPVSGDPGAGAAAGKGCPPGLPRGSGPAEAAEPSDASCAGPVVTAADVAACSAALAASPHHQDTRNPEETRAQLEEWLPRSLWPEVNLLLVGFGQTVCLPRDPACAECVVRSLCPTGRSWEQALGSQEAARLVREARGEGGTGSPPRRRRTSRPVEVDMTPVAEALAIAGQAAAAEPEPVAAGKALGPRPRPALLADADPLAEPQSPPPRPSRKRARSPAREAGRPGGPPIPRE